MFSEEEFCLQVGIEHRTLRVWVAEGWLAPGQGGADLVLSEMDAARARLIRNLRESMGVNDEGIGVIPWSPLARGRLTRDWDETTARSETDEFGSRLYAEGDRAIVERVAEVAGARGVPRAQVALAWLLSKPVVTAPIVGVTKDRHLDDAVAAVDLRLTPEEIARLEEPYTPHAVVGFS